MENNNVKNLKFTMMLSYFFLLNKLVDYNVDMVLLFLIYLCLLSLPFLLKLTCCKGNGKAYKSNACAFLVYALSIVLSHNLFCQCFEVYQIYNVLGLLLKTIRVVRLLYSKKIDDFSHFEWIELMQLIIAIVTEVITNSSFGSEN